MAKAKKLKQLSCSMPDRAGLLFEVTDAIATAKINITSICAYGMDNTAYFMLITENNAKAKKALVHCGLMVKEDEVVAVDLPNKAGELQKIARKIADAGINIVYMYATAAAGKSSTCIFKTSDDKKAIKVINT